MKTKSKDEKKKLKRFLPPRILTRSGYHTAQPEDERFRAF